MLSLHAAPQTISFTFTHTVILGGFGGEEGKQAVNASGQEALEATVNEVASKLVGAKSVIIVPGYGMAVAKCQWCVGVVRMRVSTCACLNPCLCV